MAFKVAPILEQPGRLHLNIPTEDQHFLSLHTFTASNRVFDIGRLYMEALKRPANIRVVIEADDRFSSVRCD